METRSSRNKILLIAVIILLLTNIGILAFFLTGKAPDKGGLRGGNREAMVTAFLQNDIGFDKTQMNAYDTLSKMNKENMKASFDEIRNNRQALYKELGSQAFNDSAINAAAVKVADKQKDIEVKMLSHFAAIRKLCNPAQQAKFDSLFYKIWNKKDKPGN